MTRTAEDRAARSTLREERETIIRWDEASPLANLYTASPAQAAKWRKRGLAVSVNGTVKGEPHSWTATAPKRAITVRRLVAGAVATRKPSGTPFQRLQASQSETTPGEAGQTTPS